jgi:glycosyltransferase involved in cell wall biosynthesis
MKISVIIPNYNYGNYLTECLTSVFGSDIGKEDYEILLIDDASTDLSVARARDIAFHHRQPLRIFRNLTNAGLVISRNRGISEARGDYLFFLDSDNLIGPSCLRKHLETMESSPDIMACYAPISDFHVNKEDVTGIRSNEAFDYERLLDGNYIDAMAMFRRSVFDRIGPYDTKMPLFGWEDYEMWLRLGTNKCRVQFIEGPPLSYYRVHESSMLRRINYRHMNALRSYLTGIYQVRFDELPEDE